MLKDAEILEGPQSVFTFFRRAADCELVFVARLDSRTLIDGRSFREARSGVLTDIGIAGGSNQPITVRQRSEKQPDTWVLYDRVRIEPDETCRGIGWIVLREQLAYDVHYRSQILWTGIMLEIRLSPQMLGSYEKYLGDLALPTTFLSSMEVWKSVIFRVPVKNFALPVRRGGFDLEADGTRVGKLRKIKRLEIRKIEIQKLCDQQGNNVRVRDGLPEDHTSLPLPLIVG